MCVYIYIYSNNKCMCVFIISPVPITEPLTSELIDTPVFHNLAPRPIKYRVSVPIPISTSAPFELFITQLCAEFVCISLHLTAIFIHSVANSNPSHWISQRCAVIVSQNQLWFLSKAVLSSNKFVCVSVPADKLTMLRSSNK